MDRLLDIGAVGCNLEDTDHRAGGLVEPGAHADWLAGVRSGRRDAGVPIVINARVDTFLPGSGIPDADRLDEAVRRGRLYREAGADCIYPIGVRDRHDIATLVDELPGPVNGNTGEFLDLAALRDRAWRGCLGSAPLLSRGLGRPEERSRAAARPDDGWTHSRPTTFSRR